MPENTVLITGSDGYVGSHVAKAFKDISWYVCGLDRTGANENARSYCNEFLRADYGESKVVGKYIETIKPDVIVHPVFPQRQGDVLDVIPSVSRQLGAERQRQ